MATVLAKDRQARVWQSDPPEVIEQDIEYRSPRHFYLEVFWQGLVVSGICSYISVFLVRMGASPFQMGLLSSLPALASLLFSLPAALFVESRRDLVRITSIFRLANISCYLLVAAGSVLLSSVRPDLVPWVGILAWTGTSVALAFSTPSWTTLFAGAVSPNQRPAIIGTRSALFSLVTGLGVVAVGRVLEVVGFPLGYQIIFVGSFLCGLMSIFHLSRIKLPADAFASYAAVSGGLGERLRGIAGLFREQPGLGRYAAVLLLYRLTLGMPAAFLVLFWVNELGAGEAWVGYQATAGSIAQMVGYLVLGRLAVRIGRLRVLSIAAAGLGLYPILTGMSMNAMWLVPVAVVGSFFNAGLDITIFETVLRTCRKERRASGVAVNGAVTSVAGFVSPLVGTALVGIIGMRPTLWLAGILIVVTSLGFLLLTPGEKTEADEVTRPARGGRPGGFKALGGPGWMGTVRRLIGAVVSQIS